MTAEYIRDWQQPRHAVGREGTGIPAPESALSSWLDAYRVENERRQEMADAAFSATPLGNLINKSLDAQEKQDKTITLAGDARKQARGAVDEAMASLRLLPSYLRDPLIRHLSFLRKKLAYLGSRVVISTIRKVGYHLELRPDREDALC